MQRFLNHLLNLGWKEILALWRDPFLMAFLLYAFTGDVISDGQGLAIELKNAFIAVVDEDRSPLSARIADGFREPFFRPPVRIDRGGIDRALDEDGFTFVVDLPPAFQADLLAGRSPAIQVNADATAVSQAYVGAAYIQHIVAGELQRYLQQRGIEAEPPVEAVIRVKYNPNRLSSWAESLRALLTVLTYMSMMLTGIALLREREHGTIEHLLVMPLGPGQIVLAKAIANSLFVLLGFTLCLAFVIGGFFGVAIQGSIALLYLGTVVYLLTTAGLGIFLATTVRTIPQFSMMAILALLPIVFLSGSITPIESMPPLMRTLTIVSPLRYYAEFADGIVFRGAGLEVLWPQLAAMGGIGVLLFGYALLRFRAKFSAAGQQ